VSERVIGLLKQACEELKAEYAAESIRYELTEEGDAQRRAAAAKMHAIKDVHVKLKAKLKENL
tara:strand:+ start:108 stop:296 length:189 start_codon:yes stop_codon:yes gene_type:complete